MNPLRRLLLSLIMATLFSTATATSTRERFDAGWRFARFGLMPDGTTRAEPPGLAAPGTDDHDWRRLNLPHDWGIEGPFRPELPGDTGKLPWAGIGWYRKAFALPAGAPGRRVVLAIDGAMSHPTIFLNGEPVGEWAYGYASFRVDLTSRLQAGTNVLAIRLDNPPDSSRWYPGGGLYRHVWLETTGPLYLVPDGVFVKTPVVSAASATVEIDAEVAGAGAGPLTMRQEIMRADAPQQVLVAGETAVAIPAGDAPATARLRLELPRPALWSVEQPTLHVLRTTLLRGPEVLDRRETTFGVRAAEFTADDGFQLNGRRLPLNGVCEHHDLGPLGAAFNTRAMERKLEILRSFGVNAIRTSHNPPAPELLDLCDRLGFVVLDEAFDCWRIEKTANDYHRDFDRWHLRDLTNFVRRDRNHASVVLWSTGNEIPEQRGPDLALARQLVAIVKSLDPTRPVTNGLNFVDSVKNGFASAFDAIGLNYKPSLYAANRQLAPGVPMFSSESSSTISSRGEYFFPVSNVRDGGHFNLQISSYDLYYPRWATTPDMEWEGQERNPFVAGEFVWTGFDYLGEPTPYDNNEANALNFQTEEERQRALAELAKVGGHLPSRSSYFGIVDLCGFPKDRYFLYQSHWRPELPMAHLLPHWTWPERVGQVTPVMCYTSGDEAELFLNGRSLGRKTRGAYEYRFRWDEVVYEPGELKVVTYRQGRPWATDVVRTAGAPARIELTADRTHVAADGDDLVYLTVRVLDAAGTLVPRANLRVTFTAAGPGDVVAVCNGDATSFEPMQANTIQAWNGMAQGIVRTRRGAAGDISITATASGLPLAAAIGVRSE